VEQALDEAEQLSTSNKEDVKEIAKGGYFYTTFFFKAFII
jgi:hypothetical protein